MCIVYNTNLTYEGVRNVEHLREGFATNLNDTETVMSYLDW